VTHCGPNRSFRRRELATNLARRREREETVIVTMARELVSIGHDLSGDRGVRSHRTPKHEEGRAVPSSRE
jgi:hypothetical protein